MGKRKKTRKQQPIPSTPKKRTVNYRDIAIILGIGLILRIFYDVQLAHSIFLNNYVLDSLIFHSWALDIINGDTADLVFFRAPLYPYLVALIYKILGVSQWSVVIVQHILGLLTCVVGYLLAVDLFGRRVAFWSGIFIAAFPTLIYFEGEVMITTLATLLYTVAAWRLYWSIRTPSMKTVALAGLAVGLAAIARPTILPLLLLFPILFLLKYGLSSVKRTAQWTVILLIGALIPILPVTITNIAKGGEFVLLASQGGINFYLGNGEKADGISVIAPGPNIRFGKYEDNIWTSSMDESKRRTGKDMSQSEISSFWYNEAFREMSQDIPRTISLFFKKIYFFWHGQEIFNNKSLYYAGEYSWLMKILIWKKVLNFPSGLLFPLMFVGVYLALRGKNKAWMPVLFVFGYGLLVSVFFVCARFRQPIIPLAIILAVFGVFGLMSLKQLSKTARAFSISIMVIMLVLLNLGGNVESNENLSQFNTVVGSMYQNEGDHHRALPYLEKAFEISPDNGGVVDMLGQAYLNTRNFTEAERVYRVGITRFPAFPPFNVGMARIFQARVNGADSALFYFHQALKSAPDYPPAIEGVARIYEKYKVLDSALYYYTMLSRHLPPDRRLEMKKQQLREQISQIKKEN